VLTHSVALLADLIHNFGDALTAVPLAIAFYLRSFRGEKIAGLFVVFAIFASACVALYETIQRFIHPHQLTHLWVLAAAGVIGFIGNEIAARVRLRAGRTPLKSGAPCRRQPRARRRLCLTRSHRERDRRCPRLQPRRSDHRPRDHTRDPQDQLELVAYGLDDRARRDARPLRNLATRVQ
jgi:hypothetical protein